MKPSCLAHAQPRDVLLNRKRGKLRGISPLRTVKNLLINVINGRGTYTDIEQLSEEILTHAETIYALQQKQT